MSDAKFAWRLDVPASNSTLAYSRLRQAILSGQFQPGQRVTETGVAALLGVSRTPVREAFTRLTMDGLLRSSDGNGVEVVDPRGELADIYLLREMAEGCAARLAASRATPEEIDAITTLAAATGRTAPNDLTERVRLNEQFHLAIAAAAHAPRVERLVNDYRSLFVTEERLEHATSSETKRLLADHRSIAEAILRRDPDAAETAMRDHLRRFFAAENA
jgi:DNA-binding GntR family transcriptional regulator